MHKRHLIGHALLVTSFLLILYGAYTLSVRPSAPQPISVQTKRQDITVDIAGAVMTPGIYTLAHQSRLSHAIMKAGGFSPQYDAAYVAKSFNLAKKLKDEEKIYVPYADEAVTDSHTTTSLNTGSKTQLELLPHIGPVTAQKIIDGRPYSDTNELLTRKILGQKIYTAIVDMVTL